MSLHSFSFCDCLSFFSIRSGTGHILHYNLSSAFPQWWYSQYFTLHQNLYFSHLPSIPAQRRHRVSKHILYPHGHTWVTSSVLQRYDKSPHVGLVALDFTLFMVMTNVTVMNVTTLNWWMELNAVSLKWRRGFNGGYFPFCLSLDIVSMAWY